MLIIFTPLLPTRLRELRGPKTQVDMAKELRVNQQTYARWELGDRQPKLNDLCTLSLHFGVSADWLLGLDDNRGTPANGVNAKIVALKRNAETTAEAINGLLRAIEKLEGAL